MPTAEELARPTVAAEGDGADVVDNGDGTTTTSWPDGTSRVDYSDGSATVTYPDGAVLNLYPDGTVTLNDVNGVALDPVTGAPLDGGGGELPTPPDLGPDRALKLLEGEDSLGGIGEAMDLLETFSDAVKGEIDPTEWVKAWLKMVLAVIKALETEERGCYLRGWCYAVLYGALDQGTPPRPTFSGSLQGPDQDSLDAEYWDRGVAAATEQLGAGQDGVKLRNRVLLRLAQDRNQPATTLDAMYQAACAHTDDWQLARAYEHLGWPQPTGA